MHPEIEVAAGLVFREGKLLITQRRPQDHLGGLWEFPGGKRIPGERFEDCLQRELREELGIEVHVGDLLEDILYDYPQQAVRLLFFHCVWLKNEPQPLGCHAVAWVSPDQLERYHFPPADARLVERLQRKPELWQ